jgi:hypothetical protein
MWSQFPSNLSRVIWEFAETGSTLFSGGLFWDQFLLDLIKNFFGARLRYKLMYYYFYQGFDLCEIIQFSCKFECIEFECNKFVLVLVFGGLFWRQFKIGGNWLHIIFQWIVLGAAQNWWELVQHYFPADCFGGSLDGLFRDRFLFDLRSFFGARYR